MAAREFDPEDFGDIDLVLACREPGRWRVSDTRGDLFDGTAADHWLYQGPDRVMGLALLCPEQEFVLPTRDPGQFRAWLWEARHDGDTGFTDGVIRDYTGDRAYRFFGRSLPHLTGRVVECQRRREEPGWYPPANLMAEVPASTEPRPVREVPELGMGYR